MEFKQIIYAILTVIVIIFAVFFLIKGWPLIESVLNIGNELGYEAENVVTIREKFNGLINSYKECAESEKANCICRKNFPRFPANYILSYSSSESNSIISLSKESEVMPVHKEALEGVVINCFAVLDKDDKGSYKYKSSPSTILIKQDKSGKLTVSGALGQSKLEESFNDDFIPGLEYVYKYDKKHLCLLLDNGLRKRAYFVMATLDEDAINYFKNLHLCT